MDPLAVPTPGRLERFFGFMARHWLLWANLLVGLYAGLPWLSPLARAAGLEHLGRFIFRLYSPPMCHQLPGTSYHLLGYQVAYCERDTALYTAILAGGLLFGLLRRRARPLPGWLFVLLTLPIFFDGVTQSVRAFVPDWPIRAQNPWAIWLTKSLLPAWFYGGDQVGHLNWLLRTVTGALFGLALAWTVYPRVEKEFQQRPAPPVTVKPLPSAALRSPHVASAETCPAAVPGGDDTPPPAAP